MSPSKQGARQQQGRRELRVLKEQPLLSLLESAGNESHGGARWFLRGLVALGFTAVEKHNLSAECPCLDNTGSWCQTISHAGLQPLAPCCSADAGVIAGLVQNQ